LDISFAPKEIPWGRCLGCKGNKKGWPCVWRYGVKMVEFISFIGLKEELAYVD
jgi:hypothetical protein